VHVRGGVRLQRGSEVYLWIEAKKTKWTVRRQNENLHNECLISVHLKKGREWAGRGEGYLGEEGWVDQREGRQGGG